MTEAVVVNVESPLQDEVAALLNQSDMVAARLYPGEYRRPITSESLAKPGNSLLVARLAGKAVGLCVVFDRGDGDVELKRMIVEGAARGQGIGSALIHGVFAEARRLGARAVLLEVGIRNTEAQTLYRSAGFTIRDSSSHINPHPSVSLCNEWSDNECRRRRCDAAKSLMFA